MKYDYSSVGFYTFDCLGWPYVSVPPGGGTVLLDDITLAVSGAAGVAAIVGAKLGLKTKAVGGVGRDLMGDWVLNRIADFGVDGTAPTRVEALYDREQNAWLRVTYTLDAAPPAPSSTPVGSR